ncbi:MAG TPA: hypothetical protein PKK59_08005 [Anaerolineaceae bacterium]|nr:hypothetical protein [Anaerolineaceae bacterium]
MKHLSKILILFYITICSLPFYWIIEGDFKNKRSLIEYRTLEPFPTLPEEDFKMGIRYLFQAHPVEGWKTFGGEFLPGRYQSAFEIALSDHFPLRSTGIRLANDFNRLKIKLVYAPLNRIANPADMRKTGIYVSTEDSTLFYAPRQVAIKREFIDNTLEIYRAIINTHPQINIYVYSIELIEHSLANPLNINYPNGDAGRSLAYFAENIPEGLTLGTFTVNDFDEYQDYFYRTDHHWNIYGALKGYKEIYRMLAKNYPEISPRIEPKGFYTFPDFEFHGSLARFTLYKIQPGDSFTIPIIDLPAHRVLDEEGNRIDIHKRAEYHSGEYSVTPFTDHYVEYFGWNPQFYMYEFENNADRNLLLIGDSHASSIRRLLASHYQHTYAVDVRNQPEGYFSLSDFLLKYEVDDVLFIGGPYQTINHDYVIAP